MSQPDLCTAIRSKRLVSFYYSGDVTPGIRTVEPHMVAYNRKNHLSLSAKKGDRFIYPPVRGKVSRERGQVKGSGQGVRAK